MSEELHGLMSEELPLKNLYYLLDYLPGSGPLPPQKTTSLYVWMLTQACYTLELN